jgi:hypothetical protein
MSQELPSTEESSYNKDLRTICYPGIIQSWKKQIHPTFCNVGLQGILSSLEQPHFRTGKSRRTRTGHMAHHKWPVHLLSLDHSNQNQTIFLNIVNTYTYIYTYTYTHTLVIPINVEICYTSGRVTVLSVRRFRRCSVHWVHRFGELASSNG